MNKITKIMTAVGISSIGALGVGIPLIVIETNKVKSGNNSKINLSKISTNSVQFSIPLNILKEVPVANENKKAKIILKNGEKEVIIENNFKIEENKVNFKLFNLEPETEYKLIKVKFSDNNDVDLSNLNTFFKTESLSEPNKDDIEKKDQENTDRSHNSPKNPPDSNKTEKPKDEENIIKRNVDSIKFSYWALNNFSPVSKAKNRVATVEKVIRDLNPDLILLSGMSPASGENIDALIASLDREMPNSNWGHITSPRGVSSAKNLQKRYTFLYKKSLLEFVKSNFDNSNQGLNISSQGFASTVFKTDKGKLVNLASLVLLDGNLENNSKKAKKKNKKPNDETDRTTEISRQNSEKIKTELEKVRQQINSEFKDKNFIFAGTFQTNNVDSNNFSLSKTLESYKTLLDPQQKNSTNSDSPSTFLITSQNIKINQGLKIEDISATLDGNPAKNVSSGAPISVTIDLKN